MAVCFVENSVDSDENLSTDCDGKIPAVPAGSYPDLDVETAAAAAEVVPNASSAYLARHEAIVQKEVELYAYPCLNGKMKDWMEHRCAYRDLATSHRRELYLSVCYPFHHLTSPYQRFQQYPLVAHAV